MEWNDEYGQLKLTTDNFQIRRWKLAATFQNLYTMFIWFRAFQSPFSVHQTHFTLKKVAVKEAGTFNLSVV